MRILGVIDSFTFGGAETQLAQMLSFLASQRGHECVACSLLSQQHPEVEFPASVRRVYLDKRSRLSLPRVTRDLARLVRQLEPHVVYSRLPMANALSHLASRPPRSTARHVAGLDTVPAMYTLAYTLAHPGSLLFRRLERYADCLACNSDGTRQAAIATGYPGDRLRVVPNGIDVERFQPPAIRPQATRTRLLCVASLRPEKGVDRLIRVLAPLLRGGAVELRIVGDGAERPVIERTVARLGVGDTVELAGARADVLPALQAADLFVSAALVEGFGIAAAEAAAAALPVIAFRAPGGLGEVVVDGVTGCLIAAEQPEEFGRAVERLASDSGLRNRMGLAARRHIVEHFSLPRIAEQLEACFAGRC